MPGDMLFPPESLDWQHAAMLTLIGLLGGMLGGLLGVGGGIVMIPSMLFILGQPFGPNSLHLYKLASIIASTAVSIPAAVRHIRSGAVIRPLVWKLIPAAAGGMLAGVLFAQQLVGPLTRILQVAFGGVMTVAALVNLWQTRSPNPDIPPPDRSRVPYRSWLSVTLIGTPAGALAGLFGIGGGIWAVPVQHYGFRIRIRHAIATSSCLIVFISALTAAVQSWAVTGIAGLKVSDGWWLAAALAPGAAAGGWFGAALTHILPTNLLRKGFMLFLLVAGIRMMAA